MGQSIMTTYLNITSVIAILLSKRFALELTVKLLL